METGISHPEVESLADYRRSQMLQRGAEMGLRQALADKEVELGEKDDQLHLQDVLGQEADHRVMNSLQMIVSLLSMQSRTTHNVEAAEQLNVAANRVAMIVRVHRRLHSLDDAKIVAFKRYLEDLCCDFATMVSPHGSPEQVIVVEGAELSLPAETGIPLGFVVSELITNAAKHGKGNICVRLDGEPGKGYALSVSNDGSVLPDGFDPASCKGLGMKIVRSFVGKLGGELRFGRAENDQGTRFTVLFD